MARPTPSDPGDLEDEDAFHWAGDEVGGRESARLPGEQIQDAVAGPSADVASEDTGSRSRPVRALLTVLFAILYLALTVGWILGVGYASSGTAELLPEILWQFAEFTAIVAAPLWFGATVLLTRDTRTAARVGWLALGVGVLLPWPVLPLLVLS